MIAHMTSVKWDILRPCSLTEEGAEAIAKVAEKAHLKDLNLYMNDIGDAGIFKVCCTSLRCHTHLLLSAKTIASKGLTLH